MFRNPKLEKVSQEVSQNKRVPPDLVESGSTTSSVTTTTTLSGKEADFNPWLSED